MPNLLCLAVLGKSISDDDKRDLILQLLQNRHHLTAVVVPHHCTVDLQEAEGIMQDHTTEQYPTLQTGEGEYTHCTSQQFFNI